MRTIYDIQDDIREIFASATVDEETGELAIDMAALDALQIEEEDKLEAWGVYIKTEIAWKDALKKERDRLDEEVKKMDNRIELLKQRYMYVLNGRQLKTTRVTARYHTTRNVVEVAEGTELGDEWMNIKETKTISKTKLKEALLEGKNVPGVKLVDKVSLVVK